MVTKILPQSARKHQLRGFITSSPPKKSKYRTNLLPDVQLRPGAHRPRTHGHKSEEQTSRPRRPAHTSSRPESAFVPGLLLLAERSPGPREHRAAAAARPPALAAAILEGRRQRASPAAARRDPPGHLAAACSPGPVASPTHAGEADRQPAARLLPGLWRSQPLAASFKSRP